MSWAGKDVCYRCNTTHPLNDDGERPCPKPPLEDRPADAPAVIFKGTGFYKTDSRKINTASDVM